MATITIQGIIEGTLAKAADVNSRIAAILRVLNGGIDAANISAGSITNPLMAPNSVGTNNIQDGAITPSKLTSSKTTITSASTITPDANIYIVTALAVNASITAPSGTPVTAQPLVIRIKDNGTARSISWDAVYRGIGVTLPTATTAGKNLYVSGRYNIEDAKWDIIGIGREG